MESNELAQNTKLKSVLNDLIGSEYVDARSVRHFKGAREAEDLHGIYRDLEFTKDAIEMLNEKMKSRKNGEPESRDTQVIERSLYTAALVAYARCFGKPKKKPSGKRTLLDAELIFTNGNEQWKAYHEHFIHVRDKHLAHSVNAFEMNQAGLFIQDWNADPSEFAVGVLHGNRESEGADNILALAALAEIAMVHTHDRSNTLLTKLQKEITSLPDESRRALSPFVLEFRQGPSSVEDPR